MNAEQLVLEIQAALAQPHLKPDHELRTLAQWYADACGTAHARLARSIFYLRRGFRSEAVRICEMQPALLDEFHKLYFPQRPQWVHVAQELGVSTPDLSYDLAIELNEACEQHGQHRQLIAGYRHMNTVQRPAAERRSLLQTLANAEPNNSTWRQALQHLGDG